MVEPEQVNVRIEKTKWGFFWANHLTFGLFLYRADYPRVFRVATILAIWLFLLVAIAISFECFEDIDEGSGFTSSDIFDRYEFEDFLYGLVALAATLVYAFTVILCYVKGNGTANCSFMTAVFLTVCGILGSIVGIVFFTFDFCHEWSGYWAITFLICIPIEILVLETLYMLLLWCCSPN